MKPNQLLILIAPNVSEQMGGEAVKAKQIFQYYKKYHQNTLLITHERNQDSVAHFDNISDVFFIQDDLISRMIWKISYSSDLINWYFLKKSVLLAEHISQSKHAIKGSVIIHQVGPNSPVLPRTISKNQINVFGPLNGNIYFPKSFRYRETLNENLRRVLHYPIQVVNRYLFRGLSKADVILVAGGDRTRQSLILAGCKPKSFIETMDCGVEDQLLDRERVVHIGFNPRFIHVGRLMNFKGTDLIIQSLAITQSPITLDIIGDGPEISKCKRLVDKLGLNSRVKFIKWQRQSEIYNMMYQYRGLILPSLGESNGIVIQEAMAMGLPPICLDWGGPQLLIDHLINGFLINPHSEDLLILKLAECMDLLADNANLAETLSINARYKANEWRWSKLTKLWHTYYDRILIN